MDWKDFLISQAISTVLLMVRNTKERSKWRKAMLKMWVEITRAFRADAEFDAIAKRELDL